MTKALEAISRDLETIMNSNQENLTFHLIEQNGIYQSDNIWFNRSTYFPLSERKLNSKNCLIKCLINKVRYISAKDYDQPIQAQNNEESQALSLNNTANQAFIVSDKRSNEESQNDSHENGEKIFDDNMLNNLTPRKSISNESENNLLCECIRDTQKDLEGEINDAHSGSLSPIGANEKIKEFIDDSDNSSIGKSNMNISINMENNKNSNLNIGKVNLFINCDQNAKPKPNTNVKLSQGLYKQGNLSYVEEKKTESNIAKKGKYNNMSMIDSTSNAIAPKIKLQKSVIDKIKEYSKKNTKVITKYKIRLSGMS